MEHLTKFKPIGVASIKRERNLFRDQYTSQVNTKIQKFLPVCVKETDKKHANETPNMIIQNEAESQPYNLDIPF